MSKKNIAMAVFIAAVVVVLAIGGYRYWKNGQLVQQPAATSTVATAATAEAITQSATQGTVPSIGSAINPLDSKPDLNPADKTNPFNSVKINPFQ